MVLIQDTSEVETDRPETATPGEETFASVSSASDSRTSIRHAHEVLSLSQSCILFFVCLLHSAALQLKETGGKSEVIRSTPPNEKVRLEDLVFFFQLELES